MFSILSSEKQRFVIKHRLVQSFETQYLNVNYFTFRSLFGQQIDLKHFLGDFKVFDLIEIGGKLFELTFDSFLKTAFDKVDNNNLLIFYLLHQCMPLYYSNKQVICAREGIAD